jgi:predicted Zn-dependent protease
VLLSGSLPNRSLESPQARVNNIRTSLWQGTLESLYEKFWRRLALSQARTTVVVLALVFLLVTGVAAQEANTQPTGAAVENPQVDEIQTAPPATVEPEQPAETQEEPSEVEPAATSSMNTAGAVNSPVAPAQTQPAQAPAHGKEAVPAKYDVNKIGDRGIGDGVNFYSLERERALGRALATEVEASSKMVTDPQIVDYVNRLAQNLVRHSDAKVPFQVKVIDNDEINAFALPGGYFFIHSGLLQAAANEAQLAGVMAHEIAHVAARHATKNATRMQIFNLASVPLIFVAGPAVYMARQMAGLAVPMTFLKFSRNAEREADLLGLEYSYSAGYDPAEFVRFFETIKARQQKKVSFIAKAFMTHPMTDDRIQRAQKEIATMLPARNEYVVTSSDFDGMKARLNELTSLHRINGGPTDRPVLRRRGPDEAPNDKADSKDDDRPTLHRR